MTVPGVRLPAEVPSAIDRALDPGHAATIGTFVDHMSHVPYDDPTGF